MLGLTDKELKLNDKMIQAFMNEPEWPDGERGYFADWNLLIPVCNKILKMVKEDRELYHKINLIDDAIFAYTAWRNMFAESDIDGQLHIETVYLRVIDFLHWCKQLNYNKNINNEQNEGVEEPTNNRTENEKGSKKTKTNRR